MFAEEGISTMNKTSRASASAETLIRTYLQAKDQNRPHLMAKVFAQAACLEMTVKTGAISFPAITEGLAAMTDVLVRRFGQNYENVYTFCLQRPGPEARTGFSCDWLVGMSNKEDGTVRVGCGRYDWRFQSAQPFLVERLHITIESMQVLPAENLDAVMTWLTGLPYPWCSGVFVAETMPRLPGLEPVIRYVAS